MTSAYRRAVWQLSPSMQDSREKSTSRTQASLLRVGGAARLLREVSIDSQAIYHMTGRLGPDECSGARVPSALCSCLSTAADESLTFYRILLGPLQALLVRTTSRSCVRVLARAPARKGADIMAGLTRLATRLRSWWGDASVIGRQEGLRRSMRDFRICETDATAGKITGNRRARAKASAILRPATRQAAARSGAWRVRGGCRSFWLGHSVNRNLWKLFEQQPRLPE